MKCWIDDILIENAVADNLDAVAKLYDAVALEAAKNGNGVGWFQGIYPTRETAEAALAENSLYLIKQEGQIVGTMIVNHDSPPAYDNLTWQEELVASEVLVVHTLAVHPDFSGRGIATCMLQAVCKEGARRGMKAVRLDTHEKNSAGKHLYEKNGFVFQGQVDLGLHETFGIKWCHAYEKLLTIVA